MDVDLGVIQLGVEVAGLGMGVIPGSLAISIEDFVFVAAICWGKKWGKMSHRFQPIPADLDLAKTA